MALALSWVARITTVAFEMVLPGAFGFWLDQWLGTAFIGLVFLALGFVLGMWHLLAMTRSTTAPFKTTGARRRGNGSGTT